MATTALDKVLEKVKSLTAGEQRQLRVILDDLLSKPEPQPQSALSELLLKRGVISRMPSRAESASLQDWQPVEADGKPVSQSIIEERR